MFITEQTPPEAVPEMKALFVLGRGIDEAGVLTPSGYRRAEIAASLSFSAVTHAVVFTGGRSWRQIQEGITPPAEGSAMLHHALQYLGNSAPHDVRLLDENKAISTAENLEKSKKKLDEHGIVLRPGDTVGFLSDHLHFSGGDIDDPYSRGRIHLLAELAFSRMNRVALRLPHEVPPTPQEIHEEKINTYITKLIMAGVPFGNIEAMVRRQNAKAGANQAAHRVIKGFRSTIRQK